MAETSLLQAPVPTDLFERFQKQRDRFGWTNTEFMERLLADAIPRWEATPEPRPKAKTVAG